MLSILGLNTLDLSTVILISLRLTSTLCRALFLYQLVVLIMTALSPIATLEIHESLIEALFLAHVILCMVTGAGTILPLMSKNLPIIRRSEVLLIIMAESRLKWMSLVAYVASSQMAGVVAWGLMTRCNSGYLRDSVASRICRAEAIGSYQFSAVSLLAMGADVLTTAGKTAKPTKEERPLVR